MSSKTKLSHRRAREEEEETDRSEQRTGRNGTPDPVRSLHRSVGNQAVKSMVKEGRIASRNGAGRSRQANGATGLGSTVSRSVSDTAGSVVQRQETQSGEKQENWAHKPNLEKMKIAGEKGFNAFRKSKWGKQLENDALSMLEEELWNPIWGTTGGKVAVITLSPLGVTLLDTPLPISAPEFRLDKVLGLNTQHKIWGQLNVIGYPKPWNEKPLKGNKIKANLAWSGEDSPLRLGIGAQVSPGKLYAKGGKDPQRGPDTGEMMNYQVMLKLRLDNPGWW